MAEWISVKDRLPEEHDSVFAGCYGMPEWRDSMFKKMSGDVLAVIKFEGGNQFITITMTRDGVWCASRDSKTEVTHWMPLPEPPKEAVHD